MITTDEDTDVIEPSPDAVNKLCNAPFDTAWFKTWLSCFTDDAVVEADGAEVAVYSVVVCYSSI